MKNIILIIRLLSFVVLLYNIQCIKFPNISNENIETPFANDGRVKLIFDLNGGIGTNPATIRYLPGDKVILPIIDANSNPKSRGAKGWSTLSSAILPLDSLIMPEIDTVLYAIWIYDSIIDLADIDGNGYIDLTKVEEFNNIRNALDGKWYSVIGSPPVATGCPKNKCDGYELKANLNFSGTIWGKDCVGNNCVPEGWEPIGSDATPFVSTLLGNGFEIKNLYIKRPLVDTQGLFAVTDNQASKPSLIQNLKLVSFYINAFYNVGGLVSWQKNGIVDSCSASGEIITSNVNTGGLIGFFQNGTLSNSNFTGIVRGGNKIGGLVGSLSDGQIYSSYTFSTVQGTQYDIGGFVGQISKGLIRNSFSIGNVSSTDSSYNVNTDGGIGGLVGTQTGGKIQSCYSRGNVNSISSPGGVGGLVGRQKNDPAATEFASISDSYSSVDLAGGVNSVKPTSLDSGVGVLAGVILNGRVNNSYWDTNSNQSIAGVLRTPASSSGVKLGLGNRAWSTATEASNSFTGATIVQDLYSLSSSELQSSSVRYPNTLPQSDFFISQGSFPKLCKFQPSNTKCTEEFLLPGQ